MILRNCLNCNKEFFKYPSQLKNNGGRFCSLKCASSGKFNQNYKGKDSWLIEKRICKNCKNEFGITKRELSFKRGAGTFCSRSCNGKYLVKSNPEKYKLRRILGGYIYLYKKGHSTANSDGYIAEHRWNYEQFLGRLLLQEEQVHHINRDKQDNRLENLMLLPSRSAHNKIHLQDMLEERRLYWTPERRKVQSERVKKLRKVKYWVSRKKAV